MCRVIKMYNMEAAYVGTQVSGRATCGAPVQVQSSYIILACKIRRAIAYDSCN